MKVGLVFHHDPRQRPPGIDLERLTALAAGLAARGVETDILAPVERPGALSSPFGGAISVRPLDEARGDRYQLLKTCYPPGIDLVRDFRGPLVCRLVRVVDQEQPLRDQTQRHRLLAWQEAIHRRADAVAFNNPENLERWQRLHGWDRPAVLTPTGCPEVIPARGPNPYPQGPPVAIFLGSLASGRMARLLNRLAEALKDQVALHLVGLNKSGLYGDPTPLSPLIVDHGPQAGARLWDLVGWASFGVALAVGPEGFDNDSSKVYTYLRAGLPVLCEHPIRQWPLIADLGLGRDFPYGDLDRALVQARALLADPRPDREAVGGRMAAEQGWGRRVETYCGLFERLVENRRA